MYSERINVSFFKGCYQATVVQSELLLMEDLKARHASPGLVEDGICKALSE